MGSLVFSFFDTRYIEDPLRTFFVFCDLFGTFSAGGQKDRQLKIVDDGQTEKKRSTKKKREKKRRPGPQQGVSRSYQSLATNGH